MIPNYLKKELLILFFIINKNYTSTDEISKTLDYSKRSIKESIAVINKHFCEQLNINCFIILENTGRISVHPELKSNAISYAYTLKLILLKQTVSFNYCVLLLTKSSLSKTEILEELFITSSYLNKLTQQLNSYFSSFDFTIVHSSDGYHLEGNELSIRLFAYLFLQDSFQDIEWPFQTVSIKSIQTRAPETILTINNKRSKTKNRSLHILYAILENRITNNHFIEHVNSAEMLRLLSIVQSNFDISRLLKGNTLEEINNPERKIEWQYLNFLSHIFISDIIPEKDKIQLGMIFNEETHPYCILSKNILSTSSTISNHCLSENHTYLYIYYLTLFNTLYYLIGDKIDELTNIYIPKLPFYLLVNNELMETIKKTISPFSNDETHLNLLSNLLYSLYISEIKPEVHIYLQMTKDFTANHFIKNRLNSFYNSEKIVTTNDYAQSDIVVTDIHERTESDKKVFYLDSISNEKSWIELMYLIQKVYLKKQNTDVRMISWTRFGRI